MNHAGILSDRLKQACLNIVNRSTHNDAFAQKGIRANAQDVLLQSRMLIFDGPDLDASRVHTKITLNNRVDLLLTRTRHSAIRMRHDQDSIDPQEIRGQHEGSQDIIGYPRPGVTKDFHIAGRHSKNSKRIDPRVHTGDDSKAPCCSARQSCIGEIRRVALIGGADIRETFG
jgi:hypothetical protein